jgi:glycosyltransferase involved in cell wall biosynthesis
MTPLDPSALATRPRLSLVFPAFNEAENLPTLLETATKIGDQLGVPFEIVIVDDGSRDASAALLRNWRARDERVRCIHHPSNQGYGAALRAGLRVARGELVFFSDADLQFDLSELAGLLAHADDVEIATPGRDGPWLGSGVDWWTSSSIFACATSTAPSRSFVERSSTRFRSSRSGRSSTRRSCSALAPQASGFGRSR